MNFRAEERLVESTQNENINDIIEEKIETWNLSDCDGYSDLVAKINDLFFKLYKEIDLDQNNTDFEVFQW